MLPSLVVSLVILTCSCRNQPSFHQQPDSLYLFDENSETRWSSFENPGAEKGLGDETTREPKDMPLKDLSLVRLNHFPMSKAVG